MGFFWFKSDRLKGEVSFKRLSRLSTIRVIKFKPGTPQYPIRLKLKTVNINTAQYTALSYTWDVDGRHASHDGSEYSQSSGEATFTIICNRALVRINKNLWDVLKQLRDMNSQTPLFIDRLCINFDNREERAAQTNMMGHIYANATDVIIWLGKKNSHSNETVRVMRKLVNALDWRKVPREDRRDFRNSAIYQNLGMERITLQQWRNVFSLCDVRWFSRLWTFYELANAKNAVFLYGDTWMDYNFVMDFASVLQLTGWLDQGASSELGRGVVAGDHGQESVGIATMFGPVATLRSTPAWHPKNPEYAQYMKAQYNLQTEKERAWKFLELLLQLCEPFECSDPRDRIFAPLSYARRVFQGLPLNKEWPIVDYGTSTATVYEHFANLILRYTHVPSMLATASTTVPSIAPAPRGRNKRMPID